MKVNEALADALAIEAAGPIFGLMGDANMPVWGALCKDSRTRMVWSRDDGAAILMADGYSKATGKLGVVTVTCGPGLANGANAILTAARAGTPLVVFTGEYTDDGGKGGLQALDQRQFAQACEAEFRPLARLDSLAEDIAEGFFTARTRQCPVILNMPAALWEAELPRDWDYRASSAFIPSQSHAPPEEALAEVVAALAVAKRPVLVAGRDAILADAKGDIERLGDRIGALLATSLVAKGLFDGHPWDVGISGSFSSAPTEKLMAEADFVLGIGASMNFFTSEGGMLFPSAQVARIDVKPFPAAIGAIPGLYLQGDARKTTLALLRALEARGVKGEGFRTAASRDVMNASPEQLPRPTDGLDPRELMRVLSRCLPTNAQVVCGAGHFWSWPIAAWKLGDMARNDGVRRSHWATIARADVCGTICAASGPSVSSLAKVRSWKSGSCGRDSIDRKVTRLPLSPASTRSSSSSSSLIRFQPAESSATPTTPRSNSRSTRLIAASSARLALRQATGRPPSPACVCDTLVLKPKAPSAIALRNSAVMASISGRVAARSSDASPIT